MVVKFKFIALALCVIFARAANASSNLPENERTVIALFGDSISNGENLSFRGRQEVGGDTDYQGCPSVYLTAILRNEPSRPDTVNCPTQSLNSPIYDGNRERRNVIVANWGFGGSGTDRGVSRMANNLGQSKSQLVGNQYIVLILYGTNDRSRGISSVTTRANIESMIQIARSAPLGYEPIVGLVPPRDDRTGTGPASINALNAQIRQGALAKGAQVVDHYTNFINYPGSFLAVTDQELFGNTLIYLHPNNQGYLMIAETWFEEALKSRIPVVASLTIAPIISLLLDD